MFPLCFLGVMLQVALLASNMPNLLPRNIKPHLLFWNIAWFWFPGTFVFSRKVPLLLLKSVPFLPSNILPLAFQEYPLLCFPRLFSPLLSRNNPLCFPEITIWFSRSIFWFGFLEISISNFYALLFRNIPLSPSWE